MYEELLRYIRRQQESISESLSGCDIDITTHKDDSLDDLLDFAKKNINVFPFSNVKPCWFQLYANVCIVRFTKALKDIDPLFGVDVGGNREIFSKAVASLDNALIIAGGGNEDTRNLIHEILRRLDLILHPHDSCNNDDDSTDGLSDRNEDEDESQGPPVKRRRLNTSSTTIPPSHSLPSNLAFVPKIRHPIPTLTKPSLTEFESQIHISNTPIILKNTLIHWPALTKWHDPNYWLRRTLNGHRLVPIELGQSYTDEGWKQEIMTFGRFLDEYVLKGDDADEIGYLAQHDLFSQIPELRADVTVPDHCFMDVPVEGNEEDGLSGKQSGSNDAMIAKRGDFLAHDDPSAVTTTSEVCTQSSITNKQHQIGEEVTELEPTNHSNRDTSPTPSSTQSPPENPPPLIHQNIWFGTRTVTPLHHDPYSNILTQIHGTKYIRIYSPVYTALLYPRSSQEPAPHLTDSPEASESQDEHDRDGSQDAQTVAPSATIDMSNTSTVPLWEIEQSPHEDWDEQFPGFTGVPYFEGLLGEGDAVYIPKGWWHYVRGVSAVGIGVSFWW